MKKNNQLTVIAMLVMLLVVVFNSHAQVDMTDQITNPSFETGNLTGWTWSGTSDYSWLGPNTDGDGTKDGSYICGIWNASIGDAECAQTITGLANGYYRVTALATVSNNRLTTQRLFASSGSVTNAMLYGASSNPAYSEGNLAVLGATETYLFGGYDLSNAENGPFKKLSVVTHVTDGSLKFGFRVNGKATTLGYDFVYSPKGDAGFFKFDNFTLTEVSSVATLDNIELGDGALDKPFTPADTVYTATLPVGTTTITPNITLSANGATVTGDGTVNVSSGSGSSTIAVTSIDGTTTKTYKIDYTVLTQSSETVVSYQRDPVGVNFALVSGSMRVRICNEKIVRVSYCKEDVVPQGDTLIVNKIWDTPSFTVSENDTTVIISTLVLDIAVRKSNSKVSYYDKSGNLIVEEHIKTVEPVTIAEYSLNTNTCKATFNSPVNEALYGLGQHQQGIMNYKGYKQLLDQQNGEIALPFVVSANGYGILWDNYSESEFDGTVASQTKYSFSSESGDMVDYYFMYGPEMDDVISEYRNASGAAPLFPKWSYGLFQSKDKYTTAEELLKMGHAYRNAGIPLDCIVQDWDYWSPDVWGSNTVDAGRYPDPKATVDSLHNMDFHTMISIWPVFHQDCANYTEYESIGALYPSSGKHHFYDPHNEAAREIYWNQVNSQIFTNHGWDAWWADNNEPQGWPDAFDRKDFMTAKGSGVTYNNTFPITHVAGFYRGWRRDIPEKRVFTLSRSSFPGQQRYAAASWSGDIHSNWTDFQHQLSAGLNFCLSGIPYWTTDIGGYWLTEWSTDDNNELMTRWFQYGTFCPLLRIHGKGNKSMVSTQNLKENTIQTMVKYDKLRYRLMPYIYSLAWKVTNENYTIMRHMVMEYRSDDNVKDIEDQFFFGPSMMINPITTLGQRNRSVYLPEGEWYNFWTGTKQAGGTTINVDAPLNDIPIYVKAGSIIPMGPEIQHANAKSDPIELRVYKGADGQFTIYEDAGDTYSYENGEYAEIPLAYNDASLELTIGARIGSFPTMLTNHTFKVVWVDEQYGVGSTVPVDCDTTVVYDGTAITVKYDPSFEKPISHYEAEDATLSGSAVVASDQNYYSGSGFVKGLNLSATSSVLFSVNVPKTGNYQVNLRYSAGYGTGSTSVRMSANDVSINTLRLGETRTLDTWGVASFITPLNSGANTLNFRGDSVFVTLDCIDLSATSPIPYFESSYKLYRIRPLNSSLYLEANSNGLQLASGNTTENQMWEVTKVNENLFKLVSLATGECIGVDQALLTNGASVVTDAYTTNSNQKWVIDDLGSGVYMLTASHSNLVLGVGAENAIEQQTDIDGGGQRWFLEEVSSSFEKTALYEPFNYDLNQELNNLGVAGKGWGGPWSVFEGTSADMTIQAPTEHLGLISSGNKLTGSLSKAEGLRASRLLDPRWEDSGDTIWLSFLFEVDNPSSLTSSWQGVSIFDGSSERVIIGKDWGKNYFGFNGLGVGNAVTSTSAFQGNQVWMVLKIETSGNSSNENAYLWINPDPTVEPDVNSADASQQVQINSGFDKIVCHLGNTAGITCSYDEIRLGYSFNEVSMPDGGTLVEPIKIKGEYCNINFNPNEKKLIISSNFNNSGDGQLKVYCMNGISCYEDAFQLDKGIQHQTIGLNDKITIPGIYIVSLIKDSGKYSQKILW